jgi:hypothetical protein
LFFEFALTGKYSKLLVLLSTGVIQHEYNYINCFYIPGVLCIILGGGFPDISKFQNYNQFSVHI